jgi:hypothetical protein
MKFQYFTYPIKHNILTDNIISNSLYKFNEKHLISLNNDQKLAIIFKIQTIDGDWRNISSLQIISKNEIDILKNLFISFWRIRSDVYHSMSIKKIVFRFLVLDNDLAPKLPIFRHPYKAKTSKLLHQGYTNLPNNTSVITWSNDIKHIDNYTLAKVDLITYKHNTLDDKNYVDVNVGNKTLISFIDKPTSNPSTFERNIGNTTHYYKDGVDIFTEQLLETKYIKPRNPDLAFKDNFITMDLETRDIKNKKIVFAVSIYDGKKIVNFYLSDYKNNSDLLIKSAIESLLLRKYNGYKVYLHNFSEFDGIFMLKIMANMKNININVIKRNSKIINTKLSYNLGKDRKYIIYFRDSLLILPLSLKKLGSNFNVEIKKTIYPYLFVNNKSISLNYIGPVPKFEFFDNITNQDYNNYASDYSNNWSLKKETLKYCDNDVKSLWQIIKLFQFEIFKKFTVDINNLPTLSSIAFAIYRANYLKENTIPCIGGSLYNDIKESYTGGSVDVYKAYGKDIYRYDVNSLYPSVMKNYPSPTGKIYRFKGNILEHPKGEDSFGFFNVKVSAPDNLNVPILQTRVKTNYSYKTVAPLGSWEGWYFSEEIKYAEKHGYTFEVKSGYLFEKGYIFTEYVNDLYEMKKNSAKNSANYIISKLLLNSLYGRFGMDPIKEHNVIVKGSESIAKFINNKKYDITDSTNLGDDVELISYKDYMGDESEGKHCFDNICVAIASSITAYSRISMSKIKMEYINNLYYSDTDSLDLDVKLDNKYISDKLGDFKFENKFKEALYLAPKVYGAIINESEEYVKIKGLKVKIPYKDLKTVLSKNSKLLINHEKWYKSISNGNITTKLENYTLMVTENKRKLLYRKDKFFETMPYKLINGKLI